MLISLHSKRLCDLRHIKTSKGMVTSVIDEAIKAFNNGHIKPTGILTVWNLKKLFSCS